MDCGVVPEVALNLAPEIPATAAVKLTDPVPLVMLIGTGSGTSPPMQMTWRFAGLALSALTGVVTEST
jgi:hypothetical protein